MYKYAIAGAFIVALATPALAAEFYVALDTSSKQCRVTSIEPDGNAMKQVGASSYGSLAEAQQAIQKLPECNG